MRTRDRLALVAAAGVFAVAVPAAAKPPHPAPPTHPSPPTHPAHPSHPSHPAHPAPPSHPTPPTHPSHPAAPTHPSHPAPPAHPAPPTRPSTSHKCLPHDEAYIASGILVSWSATETGTRTFSGTITVHVTKANHHAAAATGSDVTYTLSNTTVTFGEGANPPTAGDSVRVIGRISELGKKCSQTSLAPQITARKLAVHAAKKEATGSESGSTQ